jgi:hypothetical protein
MYSCTQREVIFVSEAKRYPEAAEILNPEPLSVGALKDSLGLTAQELGAAAGRSGRSAARWLSAEEAVPTHGASAVTIRRLAYLDTLLSDVIGTNQQRFWLRAPNPGFRGEAPIDLITSGRVQEVIAVLELLADGGPA